MSSKPRVRPYRWLAEYYDAIFTSFRAPVAAAREHVLRGILPGVQTACDLACGTGITALELARKGIKTYGVDLSPRMCHVARRKAAGAGLPLRVVRADMRSFTLPEKVDLVTCEYDALNHVPRPSDLKKVAKAVARALRPGGHFCFDVNNPRGFRRNWSGNAWFERPGLVMVMRAGHSPRADRAWIDIEWFIRDGACWRRRSERVEEVSWSPPEIRRALRQAGFDKVRAWDAASFFKDDARARRANRTVYLARKLRN